MPSILAREAAARAWCKPNTAGRLFDHELADAFAEILDEVWNKPWLGNATTGELLEEIAARVDTDYKTMES